MIVSAVKAQEAADALGVSLESLTPKLVDSAFRNKAKECHPDRHGNAKLAMWAKIEWAKECLKHWLDQHPEPVEELISEGDCRACGGTGRIKVGKGFGSMLTVMCQMCRGEGSVTPQEIDND